MTNVTEKALELLRSGEIERVDDARLYLVPSRSRPDVRHRVILSDSAGPRCTCEAGVHGTLCFHLLACAMREQGEAAAKVGPPPIARRIVATGAPADPEARSAYFAEKVRDDPDERYEIHDEDGEVD